MKCPECGYERKTTDNCPEWQCPSCQTAYNKHPDYNGNNYYSIQLSYKEVPSDIEIKPGKLYLYLSNDLLKGAVLDKASVVERIDLSDHELGKNASDIKNILRNPPAVLTNEQEAAIFMATSIKKNQQADISEKPRNQKDKTHLYIGFITLLLTIVILGYFFSNDTSEQTIKSKVENTSGATPQAVTKNEAENSEDAFINAKGINLEFISSKLYSADVNAKQCQNICQSRHVNDESCEKANEILEAISTEINGYKEFVQANSIDRLGATNKQLVDQINQYLWDIPNEIESAKTYCNQHIDTTIKKIINQPKEKKLELQSIDIHLDIVYSKVYSADANIRNCRVSCETLKTVPTDCSIFLSMSQEYQPDVDKIIDVTKQYGNKISDEDKKNIRQIFYLLTDIDTERDKVINCLRTL